MRNILMIALVAGLMVIGLNAGNAQAPSGLINYRDLSKKDNQRTQREDRKKREAEEAKKKAEEERRRQERTQRWQQEQARRNPQQSRTNADDKKTSSAKSAISRGVGNKSLPDGASDPTMREITEVMLDAVKTRKVDFNPEEAKDKPNLILLNKPVFDATTRVRAGDSSIATPL